MKASHKLRPVAKVAQQRERTAARNLGDSMRELEEQQKQLNDLRAYRAKYEEDYLAATKSGLSVAQVRDYQVFLGRLDKAIIQQKQIVLGSSQNRDASQANWQGAHGHSKMIDKVVEKRQHVEKQQVDKRDQRESDDRTLNSLFSRDPE